MKQKQNPENFDDRLTQVAPKGEFNSNNPVIQKDITKNEIEEEDCEYIKDKFSEMLREQIGCVDANAISWKNVAIPIIEKAIQSKEKEMLDDEIKWLEDIWEDRASYSLTEDNIQARLKELKQKLEVKYNV